MAVLIRTHPNGDVDRIQVDKKDPKWTVRKEVTYFLYDRLKNSPQGSSVTNSKAYKAASAADIVNRVGRHSVDGYSFEIDNTKNLESIGS